MPCCMCGVTLGQFGKGDSRTGYGEPRCIKVHWSVLGELLNVDRVDRVSKSFEDKSESTAVQVNLELTDYFHHNSYSNCYFVLGGVDPIPPHSYCNGDLQISDIHPAGEQVQSSYQ
ncbi:hypothetical protein DSO57_1030468 [Entomophthora muscae]|uniref:Uncharacterized protein n=1 Tax=Entomophthora muscae TaxID=34485 RepID=A0ACC2RS13_9FUNG|nr:hypothetical protein DSO57_1030468 [Entomophthora muscae]